MQDAMLCGQLDAAGMVTVSFFDWDDTFLGARTVPVGGALLGDHNSPRQRGDAWYQAPLPPEYNEILDAAGAPTGIINKGGYLFAGWVDFETGHSVPNVAASATAGQAIPESELVSLHSIRSSLRVKAAYSEDVNTIGGLVSQRRYVFSYSPFKAEEGVIKSVFTVTRPPNARKAIGGIAYMKVVLRIKGSGQWPVEPIPLGKSDYVAIKHQMPGFASTYLDETGGISVSIINAEKSNISLVKSIPGTEVIAHE